MANMAMPRRSPRLGSLRQTSVTVRERLVEKFLVHNHDVLALIQSFLKHNEDQYSDITSVLVQAEVELNKCHYIYIKEKKSFKTLLGSKCQSLKWMLCWRKKEHDDISPTHRMKRQSTSSNCPFDFLSPMSKKARYENTSKTNTILRSKIYGLQKIIERITTVDVQNN